MVEKGLKIFLIFVSVLAFSGCGIITTGKSENTVASAKDRMNLGIKYEVIGTLKDDKN